MSRLTIGTSEAGNLSEDTMFSEDEACLYSVREVGAGWSVYRWSTLEIAVVHGKPQVNLEHDVAVAIAAFLTAAERKARRAAGLVVAAAVADLPVAA